MIYIIDPTDHIALNGPQVYFNHPSHKLVSYDRLTGRLLNLKTFVADSLLEAPGWQRGYDHRSAYGLESFEAMEMLNLTQRLLEGGEAYERYAAGRRIS